MTDAPSRPASRSARPQPAEGLRRPAARPERRRGPRHALLAQRGVEDLQQVEVEQSVTRAATALGMTQSALSHALNRLRSSFGDALFVKGPAGMVPTGKAE